MSSAFVSLAHHLSPTRASTLTSLRCPIRPSLWTSLPRMCASAPPSNSDDNVMATVHSKITAAFSPTRLHVTPTYGDPNGSHVSITVVSDAFEGLPPVKRHQAVYKAIWEELSGPIHAVDQLVTKTPAEETT